jgi:hypothetical protein
MAFASAGVLLALRPISAKAARTPSAPVAGSIPAAAEALTADDSRRADVVLTALKKRYRLLDGVTVSMGATPGGAQAVAYYREGQIVISPSHVASIDKILAHEIWHIIDWRDNGRIDWGEALPPSDQSRYLTTAGSLQPLD